VLLCFLLTIGVAIAHARDLFTAVMLFAIYSALTACLFVVLDAVDVAFTEAAVGTCISTILMLGALAATKMRFTKAQHFPKLFPAVVGAGIFAAILLFGMSGMPDFADPNAPPNTHVVPRYLLDSPNEIGIPNVVTSVLSSYRGYDTLGEVVVVFTAGIGVISLLGARRKRRGQKSESSQ